MKLFVSVLVLAGVVFAADDLSLRAWQMESKGDAAGAREFLQRSAQSGTPAAIEAYAQFLDHHHDPAAREAYEKMLSASQGEQDALGQELLD